MATVNTVPYSPASSGRIHSSQRQFGPRIPVRRILKRDSGCVARADTAFARRRRSSWSLCDNQCGEAGQKRTKYVTLIRGRAVAARGALRRFLSLVGVTSRIARAKLPNLAQGTHWVASPHAQTIRKGPACRDIAIIGKCGRGSSHSHFQELRLVRPSIPPDLPRHQLRAWRLGHESCVDIALCHDPQKARLA